MRPPCGMGRTAPGTAGADGDLVGSARGRGSARLSVIAPSGPSDGPVFLPVGGRCPVLSFMVSVRRLCVRGVRTGRACVPVRYGEDGTGDGGRRWRPRRVGPTARGSARPSVIAPSGPSDGPVFLPVGGRCPVLSFMVSVRRLRVRGVRTGRAGALGAAGNRGRGRPRPPVRARPDGARPPGRRGPRVLRGPAKGPSASGPGTAVPCVGRMARGAVRDTGGRSCRRPVRRRAGQLAGGGPRHVDAWVRHRPRTVTGASGVPFPERDAAPGGRRRRRPPGGRRPYDAPRRGIGRFSAGRDGP